MAYRTLILACGALVALAACAGDGGDSTPVGATDVQVDDDVGAPSDTWIADTAVDDLDTGAAVDDLAATEPETAVADAAVDAAEEEVSASDVALSPDTTPDAEDQDVEAIEDSVGQDGEATEDVVAEDVAAEDTTLEAIAFNQVYAAVFASDYGCSGGYCHGSGAGGFSVSDEVGTYFALVDQYAIAPSCGATQLVVPGDPDSSLLWLRLRPAAMDGDDVCVPKMPAGSAGLDADTAQLVYDWILGGAQP